MMSIPAHQTVETILRVGGLRFKDSGREILFARWPIDEIIYIGRSAKCEIHIVDSKISRQHCRIVRTSMGFNIVDNDSKNGVYISNTGPYGDYRLIDCEQLEVGSHIVIGSVILETIVGEHSGPITIVSESGLPYRVQPAALTNMEALPRTSLFGWMLCYLSRLYRTHRRRRLLARLPSKTSIRQSSLYFLQNSRRSLERIRMHKRLLTKGRNRQADKLDWVREQYRQESARLASDRFLSIRRPRTGSQGSGKR